MRTCVRSRPPALRPRCARAHVRTPRHDMAQTLDHHPFAFDRVFGEDENTEAVYVDAVQSPLRDLFGEDGPSSA